MAGEVEFIMQRFRRYYERSPPPPPERFGRREFGFMFFDRSFVQRHLGFARAADFNSFLVERVPAHCYYSSAYYEVPAAEKMEDKHWLGADLIFDLDADHIRGAEGLSYEEMLRRVKHEMIRLLDEYLLGDLGFSESCLRISFSGGRGYHAHISDPKVVGLRSHERREIVDYIAGTDLNMDWVFPEKASTRNDYKTHTVVRKARLVPGAGEGGWKGRMRLSITAMLDELEPLDVAAARERYPSLAKEPEKSVAGLLEDLFAPRKGKRARDLILAKGNLQDMADRNQTLFMKLLEEEMRPRLAGQVDEPVTSDIKRLIRLPYSLHGKTSLRVMQMNRAQLADFDPLRDAVSDVFTDAPVRVTSVKKVDVRLRGERFRFEGETEVPEYAAIFLICRREAMLA
jgi:DNA primase small subunit